MKRGFTGHPFYVALTIACLPGVVGTARAQSVQPALMKGIIAGGKIDVLKPPASPAVVVDVTGAVGSIVLTWTGPSGEPLVSSFSLSSLAHKTGKISVQAYGSPFPVQGTPFSLYSEAGTWTLASVTLCGAAQGPCASYSAPELAGLFNRTTVQVINAGHPDIAPPQASSATIKTPAISISNNPGVLIDLKATDNLSGVGAARVGFAEQGGTASFVAQASPPTLLQLQYVLPVRCTVSNTTPPGDYTVSYVQLYDAAGNVTNVTDAAAIASLFNNRIKITVLP